MAAKVLRLEAPPLGRLVAATRAFAGDLRQAAASALRVEHELIMTDAKGYTPFDTGALRGSGHVQPTQIVGAELVSTGGFGGPAAPYAVIVHEDLAARHPVGQAKFYERALTEGSRGLAQRLAAGIRSRLRGR